jgi:ABC-type uncharacterized transport system substrate-binding protein
MKRREFIIGLANTAICPSIVTAQPDKVPGIGALALGSPDPDFFLKGVREGLQKLGYIEGKSFRLEFRSANGKLDALANLATELVRLKVDIIVTFQTPAAQAAKQATKGIPIVMAPAGDPVETGLVTSLARPGGNVTGVSGAGAEIAGKTIELIREMIPSARRVGVLVSTGDPFTKPFLAQIELGAHTAGFAIEPLTLRPGQEFETAFAYMRGKQVDALIVQPSILREDVVELAIKHRFATFAPNSLLPRMGGLASYSANFAELYRQAAIFVDKILKGSKPADLPVELPTKFELVINLKTAKAIGLDISPTMLLRADEVIE